jgi:DNA polymerase III epsilon subunit-like protein
MTVRVIDCETTGTDVAVDAVIEIASVDVLADGTITKQSTRCWSARGSPAAALSCIRQLA